MFLNTIPKTLDDYTIENHQRFENAGIIKPNLCFRKIILCVIVICMEKTRDYRKEDYSQITLSLS